MDTPTCGVLQIRELVRVGKSAKNSDEVNLVILLVLSKAQISRLRYFSM